MSRCEQENPEISRCLAMPLHFCNDLCTPGKQAVAVGARGTLTGHSRNKDAWLDCTPALLYGSN